MLPNARSLQILFENTKTAIFCAERTQGSLFEKITNGPDSQILDCVFSKKMSRGLFTSQKDKNDNLKNTLRTSR